MTLNCLLMLSSTKIPPPRDELRFIARQCAANGEGYLPTTRLVEGLTPGSSLMAFYGDSKVENAYLGKGVFLDYLLLSEPANWQILAGISFYVSRGMPEDAVALIKLREVVEARQGDKMDAIGGFLKEGGAPLTLRNLPKGQRRSQVYFTT